MRVIERKVMIAGLLLQLAVGTSPAQMDDAALIAKAKGIHARVITLDTHNDIELLFELHGRLQLHAA